MERSAVSWMDLPLEPEFIESDTGDQQIAESKDAPPKEHQERTGGPDKAGEPHAANIQHGTDKRQSDDHGLFPLPKRGEEKEESEQAGDKRLAKEMRVARLDQQRCADPGLGCVADLAELNGALGAHLAMADVGERHLRREAGDDVSIGQADSRCRLQAGRESA